MSKAILSAVRALIVLILLTGVVYPLVVTGIGQVLFPEQANGSLVAVDEVVIGSALIGQQTDAPEYFWGRPSAVDYMQSSQPDALISSGATNFGPANATLDELVALRRSSFVEANPDTAAEAVPDVMLFASGSGLDPHISPDAARLQVERVAAARGLDPAAVATLVEDAVEQPQLGFLGEARVNVLQLNLALDVLATR